MNEPVKLLKTDVNGRVRTARARREAWRDEFERRGSSAAQFAALVSVNYPTFASWVQQRRRDRKDAVVASAQTQPNAAGALHLMEATIAPTAGRGAQRSLVVELPCGARLSIADSAQAILARSQWSSIPSPCGRARKRGAASVKRSANHSTMRRRAFPAGRTPTRPEICLPALGPVIFGKWG